MQWSLERLVYPEIRRMRNARLSAIADVQIATSVRQLPADFLPFARRWPPNVSERVLPTLNSRWGGWSINGGFQ